MSSAIKDYLHYIAYCSLLDPNIAFIYEKDFHFLYGLFIYSHLFIWPSLLILPFSNKTTFTWDSKWTQTGLKFTWKSHCGNFPNNSKTLLHMCEWYLLINANLINAKKCYQWELLTYASLINAKQMLRYWLFFKQ